MFKLVGKKLFPEQKNKIMDKYFSNLETPKEFPQWLPTGLVVIFELDVVFSSLCK